jgi:hypothetical protein
LLVDETNSGVKSEERVGGERTFVGTGTAVSIIVEQDLMLLVATLSRMAFLLNGQIPTQMVHMIKREI